MRSILQNNGLSYIWLNQNSPNYIDEQKLFSDLERSLISQSEQLFYSRIRSLSKLDFYRNFKMNHKREVYLDEIKNFQLRRSFTRIRVSNHLLRIETGRYYNEERHERICKLCSLEKIESERHLLLHCPFYDNFRQQCFIEISNHIRPTQFSHLSDDQKLKILMQPNNNIVKAVTLFVYRCFESRRMSIT